MWLPFPYFRVHISWHNCRRLPSMHESSCLGGHGTYIAFFRCRNTTRPLAARISLVVRLWWCVPTHSPPTHCRTSAASASIPLLCVSASFWFAVTQSSSETHHCSTSLSLAEFPPRGCLCLSWTSMRVGPHELASSFVRFVVVFADVHLHTWYLKRTRTLTSKQAGRKWRNEKYVGRILGGWDRFISSHCVLNVYPERQFGRTVESAGLQSTGKRTCRIHNWWTSFAVLLHRPASISQHVKTWACRLA